MSIRDVVHIPRERLTRAAAEEVQAAPLPELPPKWSAPTATHPLSGIDMTGLGREVPAGEEVQAAREHLAECVRTLNALAAGCMDWSERFSEEDLPPGMPLQEAAIQLACGEADEARRALLLKGVVVPDEVGSR